MCVKTPAFFFPVQISGDSPNCVRRPCAPKLTLWSRTVTKPAGGYFLWVEFSENVDTLALHGLAAQKGISITPGPIFSASRQYRSCIRLNYGAPWNDDCEAGMRLLGRLILSSEGNHDESTFFEMHLAGWFQNEAVESVTDWLCLGNAVIPSPEPTPVGTA